MFLCDINNLDVSSLKCQIMLKQLWVPVFYEPGTITFRHCLLGTLCRQRKVLSVYCEQDRAFSDLSKNSIDWFCSMNRPRKFELSLEKKTCSKGTKFCYRWVLLKICFGERGLNTKRWLNVKFRPDMAANLYTQVGQHDVLLLLHVTIFYTPVNWWVT